MEKFFDAEEAKNKMELYDTIISGMEEDYEELKKTLLYGVCL